jgi:NADH:ubiquinone oxidoreductase subunit E
MNEIKELIICLGSSCFARGNKKILEAIQAYIKENHLEGMVKFRGNHCFGHCSLGPVIKIGEKLYEQVSLEEIKEILDIEFIHYNQSV